jgi:hypothetical protein
MAPLPSNQDTTGARDSGLGEKLPTEDVKRETVGRAGEYFLPILMKIKRQARREQSGKFLANP